MGKIWVEVCLISARGLRRTSSLFKLQWYAVGWIDPKNKYCTKIDSCGNTVPVWKMKFSALVDDSKMNFGNLEVQVEVYSRDSIFLRENLQGTATIVLKEFLDKFVKISDGYKLVEEIGSFQLRKRNSSKPEGFVDVSIRVSEEKEDLNIYAGDNGGINLIDYNNPKNLSSQATQPHFPPPPTKPSYFPTYTNSLQGGPSYIPTGGPAYPPPPDNYHNFPASYMSMPPDGARLGGGAGFGRN